MPILGTIGESGPDPPPPPHVEAAPPHSSNPPPPHEQAPHNNNNNNNNNNNYNDDDNNSRVDDVAMSMSSGSLEFDDDELFGDENNQHQGGGEDGGGGGGGVNNKGEPAAVVDESFISKETNQLFVTRICLSIMLLLTTILISFTIYYVLKQSEESAMQFSYQGDTKQIIDGFVSNLETQLHVQSGISTSLTSYAIMENQTFPYVVNEGLINRGPYLLKTATSGTTHFAIHPMVVSSNNNINEWESFVSQNLDWLSSSGSSSDNVKEYIWKFKNQQPVPVEEELEGGESSYYPMWENFPIVPEWVNYNAHDDNSQRGVIDTITYTYDAVFSRFDNEPLLQEIQEDELYTRIVKSENSPIFQLAYPIFNQLRDYDNSKKEEYNTNLVGIITMLLYWELSLEERMAMTELPADMTMVISSPCRFAETYRYHSAGGNIEYVSQGDLHDPKFDSYKVGIDIATTVFNDTKTTTTRPLNRDYCPYTFDIYPTQEYYDTYHTSQPMIFALVVVAVLLFATVLIIYYDYVVESNKKRAIAKHAKQENIVGQLFPKHIRDKLYKGEATGVGDIGSSKSGGGGGSSGRGGGSGSGTAAAMTTTTKSKNTAKEMPSMADLDRGVGHGLLLGVAGKNINSMNPTAMSSVGKDSREEGVLVADEKQSAKSVLKAFGKPIAEHFKQTTVFFFQVVGFDAWSSMRDPSEVFTLLQTLFQAFDMLARKLDVFKVETVGESYVAVTGVPEPQDDHAVRMARFARECLNKFTQLTHELEMELGPDTGELQCQIGLHSGAVTAGVLKGEKSRFQLFGDTMNTASRMMSTCTPNRIQCSISTADHIIFAEKDRWLKEREDHVQAKGKGTVQTYWILPRSRRDGSNIGDEEIDDVNDVVEYAVPTIDISAQIHQRQGLIDWHVSLLSSHLRRIAANRANTNNNKKRKNKKPVDFQFKEGSTAIDEVTEVVTLPATNTNIKCGGKNNKTKVRPEDIELDFDVVAQLRDYVTTIASMYRENSFHNFEHATHVTMSANKLLKRVVSPVEEDEDGGDDGHEYTYGITSNPLTPFAICFCALIHDVDHAGVSNFQLIKEDSPIARLYRHRSVAEQNSVDISWDLLMDDEYGDLRDAIYDSEEELQHFRNMVVNIVLATDIFDKHMKTIRDNRWDKAFSEYRYVGDAQETKEDDGRDDRVHPQFHGLSLKATIVMEHLIQASDVAHTMQHWDIYLKWNERLFQEMSLAYDTNRSEKDPATLWYEGEIMFFDKYIIPLAKKLADCGVFGVSSDECLNYALRNRALWAAQGDEIVEKFKVTYSRKSNRRRSM